MHTTKLRIHYWGEKILRKRCRPVKEVSYEVKHLLDEMYSLMKVAGGMGLAANQAGVDLQLIVIEYDESVFKLVNPRIIKKEGTIEFEEGCLSFPGINLKIRRANRVVVSALDDKGSPVDIEATGILAVAFQHEIDHINGIVFIDRIPFIERLKLKAKLDEIKKMVRSRQE